MDEIPTTWPWLFSIILGKNVSNIWKKIDYNIHESSVNELYVNDYTITQIYDSKNFFLGENFDTIEKHLQFLFYFFPIFFQI